MASETSVVKGKSVLEERRNLRKTNGFRGAMTASQHLEMHLIFSEDRINHQIGYVYYQLGKTEEAEKVFAEQIQKLESKLDEANRNTFWRLARMHAFQGDRDQALKYLAEYAKRGF